MNRSADVPLHSLIECCLEDMMCDPNGAVCAGTVRIQTLCYSRFPSQATMSDMPAGDAAKGAKIFKQRCSQVCVVIVPITWEHRPKTVPGLLSGTLSFCSEDSSPLNNGPLSPDCAVPRD